MGTRDIPPHIAVELHKLDKPEQTIVCFAVPTRVIRIVQMDDSAKTFRVEQLVWSVPPPHLNCRGTWRTVSTHGSETPWESYPFALNALREAQQLLASKITRNLVPKKLDRVTAKALAERAVRGASVRR
jgi:hypothetical protein